ncbi:MAG: hypothetical protein ACJ735_04880 [Actinomycetes bacterium]
MLLFALGFPLVLLALLAFMDWIEAPLRSDDSARKLPAFLDTAGPDEIEDYVRDGLKAALERHWLRQRMRRLLSRGRPARMVRTTPR